MGSSDEAKAWPLRLVVTWLEIDRAGVLVV
jgi:hypothetical protein